MSARRRCIPGIFAVLTADLSRPVRAVLPEGPDAIVGQELGTEYFEAAAPVVEEQIAKAGYRLAAWLDLIVSSLDSRQQPPGDL